MAIEVKIPTVQGFILFYFIFTYLFFFFGKLCLLFLRNATISRKIEISLLFIEF